MHALKSVVARRGRSGWFAALGVVVTLLVLTTTGARLVAGATITIQARNYEFAVPGGGSQLTVPVGSVVTWVASGDPHTVTSGTPRSIDNRFADHPASAGFLAPGDSFTTTFASVGTFPYFCEVHPEQMSGVVTVLSTSTKPPTPAPTRPPTPVPTRPPTPRPSPAPTPTAPTTPAPSAPPLPSPSPGGTTAASPTPTTAAPSPGSSLTVAPSGPIASPGGSGEGGSPVPVDVGSPDSGAVSSVAPGVLMLGGLVALSAVGWFLVRRRRG